MNNYNDDFKIDYFLNSKEILKLDDETKLLSLNSSGTLLIVSTKSNRILIFDFIARSLVIEINYLKELEQEEKNKQIYKSFKIQISDMIWSNDSSTIFISYFQEFIYNETVTINSTNQMEVEITNEKNNSISNNVSTCFRNSKENSSDKNWISEVVGFKLNIRSTNTKDYGIINISQDTDIIGKIHSLSLFSRDYLNSNYKNNLDNNEYYLFERLLISCSSPCIISIYYKKQRNKHFFNNSQEYKIEKKEIIKNTITKDLDHLNNDSIIEYNTCEVNDIISPNNKQSNLLKIYKELNYTFLIREVNQIYEKKENINTSHIPSNTILLIVKELFLIMLIEEKEIIHSNNNKDFSNTTHTNSLEFTQLNPQQKEYFDMIHKIISPSFNIVFCYDSNINVSEVISIEIDNTKSLLLVNSQDKILRLFKIDNNTVTFFSDFADPVNKRKWINSFFYSVKSWRNNSLKDRLSQLQLDKTTYFDTNNLTNKLETTDLQDNEGDICENENVIIQDLLISALSDSNSIEFVIVDLNTGAFIKRMEPFKYHLTDYVVHSQNYFGIIFASNKKIFQVLGYYLNSWEGFAPHFSFIDSNVEYLQEEDFFDNQKLLELQFKNTNKKSNIMADNSLSNINNCETMDKNDIGENDNNSECLVTNTYLQNKIFLKSIFKPKKRENLFVYYNQNPKTTHLTVIENEIRDSSKKQVEMLKYIFENNKNNVIS